MLVTIREPIWKTRSVGVALEKIGDELLVKIEYKDKSGEELYPYYLFMNGAKALTYPSQVVRGRILKIIPIDDFQKRVSKHDIKYKIHKKLLEMFPGDKTSQYSFLRRKTGKNHITSLSISEANNFARELDIN